MLPSDLQNRKKNAEKDIPMLWKLPPPTSPFTSLFFPSPSSKISVPAFLSLLAMECPNHLLERIIVIPAVVIIVAPDFLSFAPSRSRGDVDGAFWARRVVVRRDDRKAGRLGVRTMVIRRV